MRYCEILSEASDPRGECFPYAFLEYFLRHPNATLVHAMVKPDVPGAPTNHYWHAWVEDDDRVYDWQTMKLGMSKHAFVGWPKADFYELFNPIKVRRYSAPSIIKDFRKKSRHCGPWHNSLTESISPLEFYHGPTSLKLPQIEIHGLQPQTETDSYFRNNATYY